MSRFRTPRATPGLGTRAISVKDDQRYGAALRVVEADASEEAEDGSIPSFEGLYRAYAKYVATIALRLLGSWDDVDDVVHDTFLQARRSLPKLRDPGAIKGWLATITVRVARRSIRRARWRRRVGGSQVSPDEVSRASLSAEEHAYVQGAYARLANLPTDERIAWILRRVHGAQLGAVASMVGCSLATVKRRIAAADRKLKEGSR